MAENYTYIVKCRDGTGPQRGNRREVYPLPPPGGAGLPRAICHQGGSHAPGMGDQAADPGAKAPLDRRAPNKENTVRNPIRGSARCFCFGSGLILGPGAAPPAAEAGWFPRRDEWHGTEIGGRFSPGTGFPPPHPADPRCPGSPGPGKRR